MKRINLVELLKDCPKGMELDCVLWDNVTFDRIVDGGIWIKHIDSESRERSLYLYNDGSFPIPNLGSFRTKCVIFPKGKKTWEGFHRPFVEGDIVSTATGMYIGIVKSTEDSHECCTFCSIHDKKDLHVGKKLFFSRLATKEEKQIMFDIIKANGYHWNPETKTLEKLPKFKVGNKIKYKDTILTIIDVKTNNYIVENEPDNFGILMFSQQDKWELINEPKFKVGDRVKHIPTSTSGIVVHVDNKGYYIDYHNVKGICYISFILENDYELMPNKFDINTLKPFESKVLVRNKNHYKWEGAVFGRYDGNTFFTIGGADWRYCIPYKGNEHLFGNTDDCNDYFKTWKE